MSIIGNKFGKAKKHNGQILEHNRLTPNYRDEAILLLSSFPAILFISTYFAQYFAQCCSILLKV